MKSSRAFGCRDGGHRFAAVLALAVAAGLAALIGSANGQAPSARALKPPPSLGGCPIFPNPPASLPARASSLPNQAAWNQDISKAPVARNSTAIVAHINANGGDHLHPDFGSPRAYGFPFAVVDAGQRRLPVNYTAYGRVRIIFGFPKGKAAASCSQFRPQPVHLMLAQYRL